MHVTLDPIPASDLSDLAVGSAPTRLVGFVLEGALPPPFVAIRSLEQLGNGKPARWCSTFYIRDAGRIIIGSCGFKDVPHNGRVEIGYAVSPDRRRQGIATLGVSSLVSVARSSDEVDEVLAQINEQNVPSVRVAEKLGFTRGGVVVDKDGEPLVQWLLRTSS